MAAAENVFAHGLRGGVAVAVEIACLSALGASFAVIVWAIATPVGPLPGATDAPANPRASLDAAIARLERARDAFHGGGNPSAVAVTDVSGFVLHATRTGTDGGSAILSAPGAPQAAYRVGEDVAPGARLVSVAARHVEIDAGGRLIRVEFPVAPPVLQVVAPPAPPTPPAEARPVDRTLLVNSLALQPVNRGGRAIGFEIMPQADAGALAPIGLLPGDILLSVGGLEANTANLAGQREKLLSGEPVEIRFERGGQIHTTSLGRAGQ